MKVEGLVPNAPRLVKAAKAYFNDHYENPPLHVNETLDEDLEWTPSLHFKASDHLIIAAEISATAYPMILRMRHADILVLPRPIAVYCVCPEEEYLKKESQADVRSLRAHGYGLITVDEKWKAMKRHACIPLIQFIPEPDFKQEIKDLPKAWRVRLRASYDKYLTDPVSGVQDVSEVLEGLVVSAARGAAKKGWTKPIANKALADVLDALGDLPQCKAARAAIGGIRNYVKQYRNTSHHYPNNKRQAYEKYRNAQHGFRDGLKQIGTFRTAMAGLGIALAL
jgi:hypothetical protein